MQEISTEVWKPIKGYEGIYEVSSYGRVRSLDMVLPAIANGVPCTRIRHGVMRKTHIGRTGYHYVLLRNGGKDKNFRLHRLVAEAFVPNPDNLPEVNHKDEDKNNNRADNLEWCSSSYNHCYGTTIERAASKIRRPVCQMNMDGEIINEYPSLISAERATGIRHEKISALCRGVTKKTKSGYRWKFKEETSAW